MTHSLYFFYNFFTHQNLNKNGGRMYKVRVILYEIPNSSYDKTIINGIIKEANSYFFTKRSAILFLKKQRDKILKNMFNSYVFREEKTSVFIHKNLRKYCVNLSAIKINFSFKNIKQVFNKNVKDYFKSIINNIIVR